MAIANVIPQIWSARIYEGFQRQNNWAQFMSDISGELRDGNQIHLGGVTATVNVRDYSRNTDIMDPDILDDSDQVLMVDQEKYFNIYVDDVDRVQARPNLLAQATTLTSREIAKVTDEFYYSLFNPNRTAATKTDIPANRSTSMALPANIDEPTEAEGLKFIQNLNVIKRKLDGANWPASGRFAVFTNYGAFWARDYFLRKGVIGSGSVNDDALVRGELGRLMGMPVTIDVNIETPKSKEVVCAFGTRAAVTIATQIRNVTPYRPEKRFGDAVKGLFVYGGKLTQDDARHFLTIT